MNELRIAVGKIILEVSTEVTPTRAINQECHYSPLWGGGAIVRTTTIPSLISVVVLPFVEEKMRPLLNPPVQGRRLGTV